MEGILCVHGYKTMKEKRTVVLDPVYRNGPFLPCTAEELEKDATFPRR